MLHVCQVMHWTRIFDTALLTSSIQHVRAMRPARLRFPLSSGKLCVSRLHLLMPQLQLPDGVAQTTIAFVNPLARKLWV
jgi:hypothetical protein